MPCKGPYSPFTGVSALVGIDAKGGPENGLNGVSFSGLPHSGESKFPHQGDRPISGEARRQPGNGAGGMQVGNRRLITVSGGERIVRAHRH